MSFEKSGKWLCKRHYHPHKRYAVESELENKPAQNSAHESEPNVVYENEILRIGFEKTHTSDYCNEYLKKTGTTNYATRVTTFLSPYFSIQLHSVNIKNNTEAVIVRQFRIEDAAEIKFVLTRTGELHL